MTDNTAQTLREEYLARLDDAMRDLPHGVASDIRDGVAEELQGLDVPATETRIAQLGDPVIIAREAGEETPGGPTIVMAAPVDAPAAEPLPLTSRRGYAIVSALALGIGGIVVPVVGWFVGAVLVSSSTLWKRWEKAVAIVTPVVFVALSFLVVALVTGRIGAGDQIATGDDVPTQVTNPLLPSISTWHVLILLGVVLVPASGLWLLWRLRGRTGR